MNKPPLSHLPSLIFPLSFPMQHVLSYAMPLKDLLLVDMGHENERGFENSMAFYVSRCH